MIARTDLKATVAKRQRDRENADVLYLIKLNWSCFSASWSSKITWFFRKNESSSAGSLPITIFSKSVILIFANVFFFHSSFLPLRVSTRDLLYLRVLYIFTAYFLYCSDWIFSVQLLFFGRIFRSKLFQPFTSIDFIAQYSAFVLVVLSSFLSSSTFSLFSASAFLKTVYHVPCRAHGNLHAWSPSLADVFPVQLSRFLLSRK